MVDVPDDPEATEERLQTRDAILRRRAIDNDVAYPSRELSFAQRFMPLTAGELFRDTRAARVKIEERVLFAQGRGFDVAVTNDPELNVAIARALDAQFGPSTEPEVRDLAAEYVRECQAFRKAPTDALASAIAYLQRYGDPEVMRASEDAPPITFVERLRNLTSKVKEGPRATTLDQVPDEAMGAHQATEKHTGPKLR